jgi:sigma-B regulation protein RsbU (phosphoserine phosphatase)
MFENSEFRTCQSKLEPGDTLVLYTDGVTDALSPTPERFQVERLQEVVANNAEVSPEDLRSAILKSIEGFTGGVAQTDDITLLILRYLKPESS